MDYRPLGRTGVSVSQLCLGTMTFGAFGFTATDLNNFEGTRTVERAAREAVRLALLDANGPTGTFSDEDGPLPW